MPKSLKVLLEKINSHFVWYTLQNIQYNLVNEGCTKLNSYQWLKCPSALKNTAFCQCLKILPNIKNEKEDRIIDSTNIKKIRGYLEQLSPMILKPDEMDKFLGKRNLPKLIPDEKEYLNGSVSIKQIKSIS